MHVPLEFLRFASCTQEVESVDGTFSKMSYLPKLGCNETQFVVAVRNGPGAPFAQQVVSGFMRLVELGANRTTDIPPFASLMREVPAVDGVVPSFRLAALNLVEDSLG